MQPLQSQGLLLLGVTLMSSVAAEFRTVPVGELPLKSEGVSLEIAFPKLGSHLQRDCNTLQTVALKLDCSA